MSAKCFFGFHLWKYEGENVYHPGLLRIQARKKKRFCIRCNKHQEFDVHCLGLNPPEYVESWVDCVGDK